MAVYSGRGGSVEERKNFSLPIRVAGRYVGVAVDASRQEAFDLSDGIVHFFRERNEWPIRTRDLLKRLDLR